MTGMENTMIWDFVWRLVLAAIFGTIIGLDREYREKEAGFRTHFLVSLGSALMMIVSQYGFSEILTHDGVSLDPSRIAAQVVSGIGFIGAGTIIFNHQIVRGLTTAASLWATAGIGLTAGAGMSWLGSCRNDPDARRAGGVESGFPFARIAPDGGRIFGIGPGRCSGHAGPDTDGRLYGRVVRGRAAGRGRRWNNLPGYDGGQGQTRQ